MNPIAIKGRLTDNQYGISRFFLKDVVRLFDGKLHTIINGPKGQYNYWIHIDNDLNIIEIGEVQDGG